MIPSASPTPRPIHFPAKELPSNFRNASTSRLQANANNWNPSISMMPSFNNSIRSDVSSSHVSDAADNSPVHYVNIRVILPADSQSDHLSRYVQTSLQFHQQQIHSLDMQNTPPRWEDRQVTNYVFQPKSTHSFVPIHSDNSILDSALDDSDGNHGESFDHKLNKAGKVASCPLYDAIVPASTFGKDSPALSQMTLETTDLTDTGSLMSRNNSPASFMSSTSNVVFQHLSQRPSSRTSFQSAASSNEEAYCFVQPGSFSFNEATYHDGRSKTFIPVGAVCTRVSSSNVGGKRSPVVLPTSGRKSPNKIVTTHIAEAEEDEVRKCRIKTEMCMHYMNGTVCPFGNMCTYAHGEEELQMTKLLDLHESGLVDMHTYRIKPCLTWVTTGSCPFGKRCTCIHDPRIGGTQASWLPHTETQGNTISTDINVEALHQKRLNTINYDNPFGVQALNPILKAVSCSDEEIVATQWKYLYNHVIGNGSEGWEIGNKHFRRCGKQINPMVKLRIAIAMRSDTTCDWQYKYRPQHFVHGEFCMILSSRAFRLENTNSSKTKSTKKNRQKTTPTKKNTDINVVEIPLSAYNSGSNNHIMAREIAFGPDCDPSVRGVAVWFNIENEDVFECTPQQAKRFRWKKSIKNNKVSENSDNQQHSKSCNGSSSVFDSTALESYPIIRPQDPSAFDLVTDIMKHHLSVLSNERISSMKDRFESLKNDKLNENKLKENFELLRRDWLHWAWPVNAGRECSDEKTPVPPVDTFYEITQSELQCKRNDLGTAKNPIQPKQCVVNEIPRIWDSFVTNVQECNFYPPQSFNYRTEESHFQRRRLPIFELLGSGQGCREANRSPPHIHFRYRKQETDCTNLNRSIHKERCWKSLLLEPTPEYGVLVTYANEDVSLLRTEWDVVSDHFINSRSQKVLSIIQQ